MFLTINYIGLLFETEEGQTRTGDMERLFVPERASKILLVSVRPFL